jgi:hypothetical protein
MIENINITTHTTQADWALTLNEAKEHLNILDTSFDTLIQGYIAAAHSLLFKETNILIKGAFTGYAKPSKTFTIDYGFIDTIVVKYTDTDGTLTVLDPSKYNLVKSKYTYVELLEDVAVKDIRYPFQFDITTLVNQDAMIKQCLRMIVGDMFEGRQEEVAGSHSQLSRATTYQLTISSLKSYL